MAKNKGNIQQQIEKALKNTNLTAHDLGIKNSLLLANQQIQIFKAIDETLKDFPFVIFCNGKTEGEKSYYSFSSKKEIAKKGDDSIQTEDLETIKREIAEWLERNFYSVQENRGLYLVNPPYPEPSKTGKSSSATEHPQS
jgi:hypothetical protein